MYDTCMSNRKCLLDSYAIYAYRTRKVQALIPKFIKTINFLSVLKLINNMILFCKN